jgi:hypothetical protein
MQINQSKSQISSGTKPVRSFNEIMCQAIDQTLEELLGSKVVEAVYTLLDQKFGVDRSELPYRVDTIRMLLEGSFGVKGAHVIERKVAKNLYDRLLLPFNEEQGLTLADFVKLAKESISRDSYYT